VIVRSEIPNVSVLNEGGMNMQRAAASVRKTVAGRHGVTVSPISRADPEPLIRSIMIEMIVKLHIERLPENVFLATSDSIPGLVAQGRTIEETVEIARDVAQE